LLGKKSHLKLENNIIGKAFKFLNQPFPEETDAFSVLKQGAMVGLFIFFFLKFVQPFDMDSAGSQITRYSIYFGTVTFVVTVAYDFLLIYLLKVKRNVPSWTFIHWIFSVIGLLFLISLANCYLMTLISNYSSFSWRYVINAFYVTSIVGVFPIVFFGAIKLSKRKTENEKIAQFINEENHILENEEAHLTIDLGKNKLKIKAQDFLYAQSMQNYVTLIYRSEGGNLEKDIIRSTLSALLNQISSDHILQVHRSYVVNRDNVVEVSGNAQGLKLHLKEIDFIVPVSRKYIPLFR